MALRGARIAYCHLRLPGNYFLRRRSYGYESSLNSEIQAKYQQASQHTYTQDAQAHTQRDELTLLVVDFDTSRTSIASHGIHSHGKLSGVANFRTCACTPFASSGEILLITKTSPPRKDKVPPGEPSKVVSVAAHRIRTTLPTLSESSDTAQEDFETVSRRLQRAMPLRTQLVGRPHDCMKLCASEVRPE